MAPTRGQPHLSQAVALQAGRGALGLITAHEDRLKHRGIDEGFRDDLAQAIRMLEVGPTAGPRRIPRQESSRAREQRELHQWIVSFREAIARRFKDNPAMQQTFGVGLNPEPGSVQQIFEHTKTLVHVAREHLLQMAAAGIVEDDLEEAERMLERLIAWQHPMPMVEENSSVRTERRHARLAIEKAIDRLLAAAAMEFRREPGLKDLFFSILPHDEGKRV